MKYTINRLWVKYLGMQGTRHKIRERIMLEHSWSLTGGMYE
jgi:hypothetical protein